MTYHEAMDAWRLIQEVKAEIARHSIAEVVAEMNRILGDPNGIRLVDDTAVTESAISPPPGCTESVE